MANYFDGKVNPNSPQATDLERYQNLGLRDAEPNLGVPEDDGYVLTSDTLGNRSWVPSGSGPTSPFIPKDIITAKGDIIVGSASETPTVITVAPDGCILITDSSDFVGVRWLDFAQLGVPLSLFSAKGDLAVATSSRVVTNVTVGSDGQVLVADSAEPSGLKWGTITGSGIPESIIDGKGDLIVGLSSDTPQKLSVGSNGHVLMADSTEPLGVKWAPSSAIESLTIVTESLASGQDWDFWLDLGQLFSFISVSVTASPEDGWLRVYTSDAARSADTRIAPGPPLPAINSGFVTEIVTSLSEPSVTLLPIPQAFTEDGVFFRFTNQSVVTQSFSLEFRLLRVVESPCDLPPYGNNIYVNPGCVQYFSIITGALSGSTPSLTYTGGTTLLGEASNNYTGALVGGSGSLGIFNLDRGALGEITSISLSAGSGYESGDTVIIEGSLIGGVDGVDDVEILLSRFNGMELLGAWENGGSITNFPLLNTSQGVEFVRAWYDCSSMTSIQALDTSLSTNFSSAWFGCSSLVDFPPIDVSSGTNFSSAWGQCSGLTSFPSIDLSSGIYFQGAWADCSSLTSFPAGMFDSCSATNFAGAWANCALDQTSVDNILISLDTAGQENGIVNLDGGTSAEPGVAGYAAKASLESKGWTVTVNTTFFIYCTPDYPLLPVTFPPYSCNTTVNTAGVTDFSYAWDGCYSIVTFPCVDSSSVTDFSYAWNECSYLTSFPVLNTSSGTDFTHSWSYCYALTSFPVLNFESGTNFTYSWAYSGFTSFPALDLSTGTNFYGTWAGCYYMASFPSLMNLSGGIDFTYTWYYCTALTEFPALDLSSGVIFDNTWFSCENLTSFPLIDVSSGTSFSGAWQYCRLLASFPLLDVSSSTNFSSAWFGCWALASFPLLDVSSGTDFYYAWGDCINLDSFPLLDTSSGVYFSGAWYNCNDLISFPLLNVSQGIDFSRAWESCNGLTSFPALDMSLGTNFSNAWTNCTSLASFSAVNVSSGTNFQQSWASCASLTSFPFIDLSSGTNFSGAWSGCGNLTTFPAGMFDSCLATNFSGAWLFCALSQTSVDNILVSLDTAGQSNGTLSLNAGTSSAPGPAGLAAKTSLQGKGWTVSTN